MQCASIDYFDVCNRMHYKDLHRWDLSAKDAVKLQIKLQKHIKLQKLNIENIKTIAGVDVSVKNDTSQAAIVILSYPDLDIIETVKHNTKTVFPYVPGLLSFREGPVILKCIEKLKISPDLLVFDGQGLAHPRKMGLACHIGLFLEKPCIGSAKSHLFGQYQEPGPSKGDHSLILDNEDEAIGAVLRTRDNVKPIYVSPGYMVDIPSSVEFILSCTPKYKLPEPIRAAHNAASL